MHFSSLTSQKQLPYKSQITTASIPLMRSSSFCIHLIKQHSPIFILLVHLGCLFEVMGGPSGAERLNSLVKDCIGFILSPIPKAFIPSLYIPRHSWHTHLACYFQYEKVSVLCCNHIINRTRGNELPNQIKPSLVL